MNKSEEVWIEKENDYLYANFEKECLSLSLISVRNLNKKLFEAKLTPNTLPSEFS